MGFDILTGVLDQSHGLVCRVAARLGRRLRPGREEG